MTDHFASMTGRFASRKKSAAWHPFDVDPRHSRENGGEWFSDPPCGSRGGHGVEIRYLCGFSLSRPRRASMVEVPG
jgi:hypothetical protein